MVLNESESRRRRVGASLRATGAIGALVLLELLAVEAARHWWRVVRAPGPAALDEAVVLVVLVTCVLLGGWLVASTTVACAAHLPGRFGDRARSWSLTVAPAATRRVAAILVGAALGSPLAPSAAAGSVGTAGSVVRPVRRARRVWWPRRRPGTAPARSPPPGSR